MIKFSKAKHKGWPHNKKTRRWDIRLSHNNEKVGEINKDFSDRECHHPQYTLDLMGTLIHEGWNFEQGIKTKRFFDTLAEAKGVARIVLEDKELLIAILNHQSENRIKLRVNQAWSAT